MYHVHKLFFIHLNVKVLIFQPGPRSTLRLMPLVHKQSESLYKITHERQMLSSCRQHLEKAVICRMIDIDRCLT